MHRYAFYILALLAFSAVAAYYEFIYSPTRYKRISQQWLDTLTLAVNSQDAPRINQVLASALQDSAKVIIEIGFPAMPGDKKKNVTIEQFSKTDFLHFCDNTLYTIRHYQLSSKADSIHLNAGKKSGTLIFSSQLEADSALSEENMHYSLSGVCSADVEWPAPQQISISKLACVTQLHYGLMNTAR
jgi:hypothetical protein